MTDEDRKKKYRNSLIEGMHYTECEGQLILIPDKTDGEQYMFQIGAEAYTERQKKTIDDCLPILKKYTEMAKRDHMIEKRTGSFARGWNG